MSTRRLCVSLLASLLSLSCSEPPPEPLPVHHTSPLPEGAGPVQVRAGDLLPSVDELLTRYVDAVGGRGALADLNTRTCTGRQIDDRPYVGPVETTPIAGYAEAGRWSHAYRHPRATYREGCDGGIGWDDGPGGLRRDDERCRSKLAWLLDPRGPLRIREYFRDLAVSGRQQLGQRWVYTVVGDRTDAHYSLHFDVQSGLLVRIGYYWELLDYQPVDGVLVPHRIVRSRKGGSTTWVLDTIRHNEAIDPSHLAAPAALPALAPP